eukprot:1310570-Pleurochrysis_carterae.AAC.1
MTRVHAPVVVCARVHVSALVRAHLCVCASVRALLRTFVPSPVCARLALGSRKRKYVHTYSPMMLAHGQHHGRVTECVCESAHTYQSRAVAQDRVCNVARVLAGRGCGSLDAT